MRKEKLLLDLLNNLKENNDIFKMKIKGSKYTVSISHNIELIDILRNSKRKYNIHFLNFKSDEVKVIEVIKDFLYASYNGLNIYTLQFYYKEEALEEELIKFSKDETSGNTKKRRNI